MKNTIKTFGLCVLMGVAFEAGATLWNDVLKNKVANAFGKIQRNIAD